MWLLAFLSIDAQILGTVALVLGAVTGWFALRLFEKEKWLVVRIICAFLSGLLLSAGILLVVGGSQ